MEKKSEAARIPALTVEELAARIYHYSLPAWPGEFEFYWGLAQAMQPVGPVLEVACGTGRISLDLAQQGSQVTGFDLSKEMLDIARQTSAGAGNPGWELADMRDFQMGRRYGLVLVPGHSFQFMLTPEDQLVCLAAIRRHLLPAGRLVLHIDHQDLGWLGEIYKEKGGQFEKAREVPHPQSGNPLAVYRAWQYEPCTQTASVSTVWEERDAQASLVQRWERGPIAMHCIFRFEMEHLLSRAGFRVCALYGDFKQSPLSDESTDMIWVAELCEQTK